MSTSRESHRPMKAQERSGSPSDTWSLWRPLPLVYLIRQHGFKDRRVIWLLLIWLMLTAICVGSAVAVVAYDWSGIPIHAGPIHFFLTIYPPLVICTWLAIWLGFEWAFIPAYLATFIGSLYSGMPFHWALLFALADPLGLVVYALAYWSIPISPDLRSLGRILFFCGVSLIGAYAGSTGSFIWSHTRDLSALKTFAIWQGWWVGAFLQAVILNAPVILLFGRLMERVKARFFIVPPRAQVSLKRFSSAIIGGGVVLMGFIAATGHLGSLHLAKALDLEVSAATCEAITDASNAWKLAMLVGITAMAGSVLAALTIAGRWNRILHHEVGARTRELLESQEQLRLLSSAVEQSTEGMAVLDIDGHYVFVNNAFARMFGSAPGELVGTHFSTLYAAEQLPLAEAANREVMETGEFFGELLQLRRDGSSFPALLHSSLITDEGSFVGIIATVRDITELKCAEEEKEQMQALLLQSQKLEAIGRLAGGVAHDFNNLLTAIRGYVDMALFKVDDSQPLHRDLRGIHHASTLASSLTRQLLLLSRKQPMEFTTIGLNMVVGSMLRMLNRLIGEDVMIDVELDPSLWSVRADKGTIEQVIMNLVVNARDAMPQGGTVYLRTENIVLSETDCRHIPDARPGRFVRLVIQDSGVGMATDVLTHIFEPFYTTKGAGEGTGLGLSVVYGVVRQHAGWISVYSEQGKGSTFEVYLSAAGDHGDAAPDEPTIIEFEKGSGQRILVVEDEDVVRESITEILRENGYTVVAAGNAEEAIHAFEQEKGDFHLVISDVVMPGKSGVELVDDLVARRPDLRVLLSSGYADERSKVSEIKEKGYRFLQKPYRMAELLRMVTQILRAPPGNPCIPPDRA